jgi:hypothetical protein
LDISLAFFPTFIASRARAKKKDLSLSFSPHTRDEKLVLPRRRSTLLSRKQEFFFFFCSRTGGVASSAKQERNSVIFQNALCFSKTQHAFNFYNKKVIDLSFVHFCVWISSSRDLSLSLYLFV